MVVSPGNVVKSAPCAHPKFTAVSAGSPYVVTATYSGDATFNASTSNTRTIRVR